MATGAGDNKPVIIIKKKKIEGGHAHHGGAWKVAYADFVTAMMCFFLVMWLMGSDEETKASIAKYFNDPLGLEPGSSNARDVSGKNPGGNFESEVQINAKEDITEVTRPETPSPVHLDEHKILAQMVDLVFEGSAFSIEADSDKVKFDVPGKVLFQLNSVQISLEGRRYLAKVAPMIKEYQGTVTIAGHSDQTKYEGQEDIWNLSFKRALAVRDYLVNVEGVKSTSLTPAAKADTELVIKDIDVIEVGPKQERGVASGVIDKDQPRVKNRDNNRRVTFTLRHSRSRDLGIEKK